MMQQLATGVMQQLTADVLLMFIFLVGICTLTNLVDLILLRNK